jgi:hypothetical protein
MQSHNNPLTLLLTGQPFVWAIAPSVLLAARVLFNVSFWEWEKIPRL